MTGPVKLLGHPIHPMLIVFPLGLRSAGVIFDLIAAFTGNQGFYLVSYWMIAAGLVGGLLAALFGFLDWLGIRSDTRAKSVGLWHGLGLFIHNRWNEWTRSRHPDWAMTKWGSAVLEYSGMFITFHFVTLGWLFFFLPDPLSAWTVMLGLFGVA